MVKKYVYNFDDVSKNDCSRQKLFRNDRYDVIVFVYDVNSKILSCNSNYIVDVVS